MYGVCELHKIAFFHLLTVIATYAVRYEVRNGSYAYSLLHNQEVTTASAVLNISMSFVHIFTKHTFMLVICVQGEPVTGNQVSSQVLRWYRYPGLTHSTSRTLLRKVGRSSRKVLAFNHIMLRDSSI